MKNNKPLAIAGEISLLLWSLLCLVIFMYFPGANSQIYGISLYDAPSLAEKSSRITIDFFSNAMISFWGMTFYGVACTSLGLKIATIFQLGDKSFISRNVPGILVPTSFLIGNAAFSLLFLLIASLFSITRLSSIIILGLGLLTGLGQFKRLPIPSIRSKTRYEKTITGLTIAILALSLFQSSARISYDSAATYFSYAKLSALKQHVSYFLDNTFVASISQATITYSVMIQFFGDQSARMISWLFGAATIWLGAALAELVGGSKSAQRILPVLIVTSTAFLDLMGDGKVDLFSSAYSLASVYWFVHAEKFHQEQNQSLFIFSGCLTGFACILRPQNVFLLGIFFIIHLLQKLHAKQISHLQLVRSIWWMFLGACCFAFYHLMINEIILGSPLAFLSVLTKINPTDGPWDYNPNTIWVYRFLYPLVVTFKNSGASLGNISPLVMAVLPLLMYASVREQISLNDEANRLYTTSAIVLISWILLFFTVVEVRYVFFLWIILFIPVAEIIAETLISPSVILRWTMTTWIALLMGFILIRSAYISISTYSPIDKMGSPRCFDSVLCDQFKAINVHAENNERVLVLSPFRYYLRTDLFACSTTHDEYKRLQAASEAGEHKFWGEVYRQGYKYVVYDNNYAVLHLEITTVPHPENAPDWIKLEQIFGKPGDPQTVYKIEGSKLPIESKLICQQDSSGNWKVVPS